MLSTPHEDEDEDNYKCYRCGAFIINLSKCDDTDYSCCNGRYFVLLSHVERARKRWKLLKLLLTRVMPMLRTEMLKRCIEAKYSPGGNGALKAATSFRQGVKRQR